MKKFLLIIPIIIIIVIVYQGNSTEKKLKDLGYTKKEIKEILKEPEKVQKIILKNKYNKDLINILTNKDYKEDNLSLYLDYYLKYKDAKINYVISIVNNGLTDKKYSDFLGKLTQEKYFIKENTDRYLKYNKDAKATIKDVNCNLDYEYYTHTIKTDTKKDTLMLVNKYYYLDEGYTPSDLKKLPDEYNIGKNNTLREDAYDAFIKMSNAAKLDNISIKNASGYRNYEYQVNLYNNYIKKDGKKAADTYSARPGFSEHQTGLATDINKIDSSFENTDAFKWLSKNAYKYGFILRFPKNKESLTGYKYEPWHYRYVGEDVAKKITKENLTLEEYYAYYVNAN